ncbi:hypothetical protein MNBD_ACTINO02-33 [hydrothermal vent metagenome]|uniref:Uncharacterized protein n=1 Tax=hydrothermal vent metagenome TaxID=652676 RepID=A0A3B0SHG8_9ZZZZ
MLFLSRCKNDPTLWPRALFKVLEGVFGTVEEYVEDDQLRAEVQGVSGEEVRSAVENAMEKLVDLMARRLHRTVDELSSGAASGGGRVG